MQHTLAKGLSALALAATLAACGQSAYVAPAPTLGVAPTAAPAPGLSPLMGNLGDHSLPISTRNPLAQEYFDEGLTLAYGFNHEEAIRSFKDALKLDPSCAMCYWGIAYALGPNINAPMAASAVPEAWAALEQAIALAPQANAKERAYIDALAHRYSPDASTDRAALDMAYADAMRALSAQHPDDLDAATLYAEALMNLTPWNYWTKQGQPTEYTQEIVATLEQVLALNPDHAGANHFYIHAVEASHTPERALPSAERLETLSPGAGHLVHMPAHIYWRVGRYADAYRINIDAHHADKHTVGGTPDQNAHTFYSLAYYPHNIHFLFAAAQMLGNRAQTIDAARQLVADIPPSGYDANPGLEDFRPIVLFGMMRFGMWDEILEEPQPEAKFQYATGIWHWARGLAYTRKGQLAQAEAEYERLAAIAEQPAMDELLLYSFAQASTMLDIAMNVLKGELALARGEHEQGIAALEQAVAIQDNLHYIEPPAWHFPVRHNLGAALMALGKHTEAEAVYREDLRQYPLNGWSLFGLAESLRAQGRQDEAQEAQEKFEEAWEGADVELVASSF
jgi:tetratricopeptide (TPR) repeat protein